MTSTSLKTLAAATLIAVASGTASYAATMGYSYIVPGHASALKSTVDLDLVTASADGTISIYDYSQGTQGKLLGSTTVHAGANKDVKVQISPNTAEKALIVLTENGTPTPVATSMLKHVDES